MGFIMNATIGQLIGAIAGSIAVLSVFIEIVPVKINPISAVLVWIGKRTTRELADRFRELEDAVDDLTEKYDQIEQDNERREAIQCRVRILRFSDELRRGIDHSQESFEQTLEDTDTYEKYCADHPLFKNNKTVTANERIKAAYRNCLEKNNFL